MNRAGSLSHLAQHARESLHDLLGPHAPRLDQEPAGGAEPDEHLAVGVPANKASLGGVAGVENQIAWLGHEQARLSSLIETQQEGVQAALKQLREQDAGREQERASQRQADRAEARLDLIQRLLPVLDGLDTAVMSGERLLRLSAPAEPRAGQAHSGRAAWYGNAIAWTVVVTGLILRRPARPSRSETPQTAPVPSTDEAASGQDSFAAWLRGLRLVRERYLVVLAAEGVRPIETVGQPFDPNVHVAIDTAPAGPDVPAGVIVSELRRGYTVGPRVLRYAEVIVAREVETPMVLRLE
jgi:molecular chaperone GrpE (heat shock protein)